MASKPMTKPISERAMEARNGNGNKDLQKAPQESAAPPAELMEYADQQTGRGVSTSSEDRLVPLLYVLQKGSPQVDRDDKRYIPGAEQGDFWLRNAPSGLEIIKGKDGMLTQSCWFYKDVGEWLPRLEGGGGGQGFRGRHNVPKPEMVPGARKHDDGKQFHWTNASGEHDLVETRNHAVLIYHPSGRVFPYLIPFTSTGHSSSRSWMTKINDQVIQSGSKKGEVWDSYARLYKLTTERRENDKGVWYTIVVDEGPWCKREQYLAGNKFALQFERGERVAEEPDADPDVGDADYAREQEEV
jgi:hypothetical protein